METKLASNDKSLYRKQERKLKSHNHYMKCKQSYAGTVFLINKPENYKLKI